MVDFSQSREAVQKAQRQIRPVPVSSPELASIPTGRYHFEQAHLMDVTENSGRLTAADRRIAKLWRTAPWLALLVVTLVPPAFFGLIYLLTAGSTMFLLLTISAIPFSLLAAIIIATVLVFLRRNWTKRLRDRLASDGITADEVEWFMNELTTGEKRALKTMERQQRLLADASRATLALRLAATRLAARARRELLLVERRLNRARYLNA